MKGLIKFSLVLVILIVALFVLTEKVNANSNCYTYSKTGSFSYSTITNFWGNHNNGSGCGAKVYFYNNKTLIRSYEFNLDGTKCYTEGCIKNYTYGGRSYTEVIANKGYFIKQVYILNYLVP